MLSSFAPPVDQAVSHSGQIVDTVGTAVAMVVIVVAAVRLQRRHHTWVPVMIVLGALLASFEERMYNITANLWYFQPGQQSLYHSFGGGLPVWVAFSYGACYGGLGIAVWWLVRQGLTRSSLYRLVGGLWVAFCVLEIVNIKLGTYVYYGPQPLRVAQFPVWIPIVNVAICVALGVAAARFELLLPGRKVWGMVVMTPALIAGGLFGASFPMMVVLHGNNPPTWLLDSAAVASILLAVFQIGVLAQLLPAGPADAPASSTVAPEVRSALSSTS